jgi:hypothetical protein
MKPISFIALTIIPALLFASPSGDEAAKAKGDQISAALLQKLGGELKNQMQTSGPLGALRFCSQHALTLTDQIAKESATSIRRVSLKHRNPINQATPSEAALLREWESLLQNGQPLPANTLSHLPSGKTLYYKPLLINNEACLKCHGNITGELAEAIQQSYPEDKATGYKMGDLRGMIVIESAR